MKRFLSALIALAFATQATAQTTIPNLPTASSVSGSDVVACSQAGVTRKCSWAQAPVSTAAGAVLALKAPLASPALTGAPTSNGGPIVAAVAASGNGTTDETAAINAALTAGALRGAPGARYRTVSQLTAVTDFTDIDLAGGVLAPEATTAGAGAIVFGSSHLAVTTATLTANADPSNQSGYIVSLSSTAGMNVGDLFTLKWTDPADDPTHGVPQHRHVTKIRTISGNTVTLYDPVGEVVGSTWTHDIRVITPLRSPHIRLVLDGSKLGALRTITAITQATAAVFTYTGPTLTEGLTLQLGGPLNPNNAGTPSANMSEIGGKTGQVHVLTASTFNLLVGGTAINTSTYSAYIGGATVREPITGILLYDVDSPDLDVVVRDMPGANSAVYMEDVYAPRGRIVTERAGGPGSAAVTLAGVGVPDLDLRVIEPAGFGAYIKTNGGVLKISGYSGSLNGRGFKLAGAHDTILYGSGSSNSDYTPFAFTWGSRRNKLFGGGAVGANHGPQDVGLWFSNDNNSNNVIVGFTAYNNRLRNVEVNATDVGNVMIGGYVDPDQSKIYNTGGMTFVGMAGAAANDVWPFVAGGLKATAGVISATGATSAPQIASSNYGTLRLGAWGELLSNGGAITGIGQNLYSNYGAADFRYRNTNVSIGGTAMLHGYAGLQSTSFLFAPPNGTAGTTATLTEGFRVDPELAGMVANDTGIMVRYSNGSITAFGRVTVGAADGCGAGYRCLRVAN